MKIKLLVLSLVIIMFVSFILAAVFAAFSVGSIPTEKLEQYRINETQSYTLTNNISKLYVASQSSNVVIDSHASSDVFVSLNGFEVTRGGELSHLQIKEQDGVLRIGIVKPNQTKYWFSFFEANSLTLHVTIPENYSSALGVSLAGGNLELHNLTTDYLSLQTRSGEVFVQNLRGTSLAYTVQSGNIRLEDVQVENLQGKTLSGSLLANDVLADSAHIESASGNLVFSGDIKKLLSATAISGNVILDLPNNYDYIFDLETISGNKENSLEGQSIVKTGASQDTAVRIESSAKSGNVVIK